MDMKRILQAMDGVATKPVVGANDMAKFIRVVSESNNSTPSILEEGANPHKVALPVQMAMQHYQKPAPVAESKPSLLKQYFVEAEEEISTQLAEEALKRQRINMYAKKIANRVLMKESVVSERVLPGEEPQPGINRLTGKPIEPAAPVATEPAAPVQPLSSRYGPGYEGSPAAYTITVSGKEYKFAGRETAGPGTGPIIKVPGGAVGIRGLAPVSVELGNGVFYTAPINESPIEMTGDPNDPTIYGHEKANPMSLKGRIMSARAQLKELAQLAERDDLLAWEEICKKSKGGMFMGLEQNLEQIRHGIEQLAAKRKQGGVASRGIDKNIGENSLGTMLQWPEVVNKVNSAMKAMGWKGGRKGDGAFMFSTKGQETDDQYYFVIIDNAGEGFFTYALGTVEEGDPHIGEEDRLPTTEASVSELMNSIRDGFGLNESKGPCWKNYKQIGTKKKGSKTVPNCVPKE